MRIASPLDYRQYASRKLPPFLIDYIEGGSYNETTLKRNISDLQAVTLPQRVLAGVGEVDTRTALFGEDFSIPAVLAPVGLTGMYARRGEVQAARAAHNSGINFTLSTVSVCPLAEVTAAVERPIWFQLYVLRDRGFMRHVLERAWAEGVRTLVFTVDMPLPGARYRDIHSGMSGPYAALRRIAQAARHPRWAFDVGLMGRPHDLGNVSDYLGKPTKLADYIGWLSANFDPSIGWRDLEWIRDFWQGNMILKGILDKDDALDAARFGADGIVVSNHGGRQLDGAVSTAAALPGIADAVSGKLTLLADSGVRSGLDIMRMLSLGADAVMLGRAYIYALAAGGQNALEHMITLLKAEMRVAMTLSGQSRLRN